MILYYTKKLYHISKNKKLNYNPKSIRDALFVADFGDV